jgi:hypothetical protein
MPPAATTEPVKPVAKPAPKPWEMPKPVFMEVKWRHADGSGEFVRAFVTKTYDGMINVLVLVDGAVQGQVMRGAKHVSDPSLKTMAVRNPGGVWDLCDAERKQMDQERRLARLEAQNGIN